MQFAVFGNTGMFGQDLVSALELRNFEVSKFNRDNFSINISLSELAKTLTGIEVVVNAVAYTSVDAAESDFFEASAVNGSFPGLLAQACSIAGARLVHISSDYVFDGLSKTPYKVDGRPNPKTAYGKSKALGEQNVANSGSDYSIIRTAWLYGANGLCFPKAIAELLRRKGNVRVVGDQFGQPTWTRDLAEMVMQVVQLEKMPRVVHAASSGKASWADFAKEVATSVGLSADAIEEISSQGFPTAAKRPAWSVLDNSSDVLKPIGDWRERWRQAAPEVLRGI